MRIWRSLVFGALATGSLVALPAPSAEAAEITVTTAGDETLDDGQTSLREAFIQASSNGVDDTIVLAPDTNYIVDFCAAGPLTHTEASALTLQGAPNASIQNVCAEMETIVTTEPDSSLTIDSVEITGFFLDDTSTVDGAALKVEAGNTTIQNSDIHGFSTGPGGRVVNGGDGTLGATTLAIVNSEIWGNGGDAVHLSFGAVTVTNSSIHDNQGDGIALTDGTPLVVTDSSISGNEGAGATTTGQGFTNFTVTGSQITGNGDLGMGCSACASVTIEDSTISGNGTAPTIEGGGVRVRWEYDQPSDAPVMTITDSFIENNTAIRPGGGINIGINEDAAPTATPAVLTLSNTKVNNNATDGFFDIDGGGIYVGTGDLALTNGSEVNGNRAGPLGGLTSSKGGGIFLRDLATLNAAADLSISNSSVDGNDANSQGGGIFVVTEGTVDMSGAQLNDNHTVSLGGGGMHVAGADVTVGTTTIDANTADVGGGIELAEFSGYPDGSLTITDSTVSHNAASFGASGGGGVFVNVGDTGADATVRNSTVSNNTSANFGGGLMVAQTSRLTLDHATVVQNTGATGANVFVATGAFTPGRSIVALPAGGGANCNFFSAPTASSGFSFADDTSCNLGVEDDVAPGVDPQLGPLASNGGATSTRLPAATSPVGGLVPVVSCALPADQRGVARPQGVNCEAGAVEVSESSPAAIMGTDGNDLLFGTPGDDVILAGAGNDLVLGGGGRDVIHAGAGNDLVFGGEGDDHLFGEAGNDLLIGGFGTDTIDGGPNRDLCLLVRGTTTNCEQLR